MKNKILWPVLFLCTLPVQAQQDMTEAEGSVTLQECLSRGLESNFSIRMVKNQQETAANNATRANAGMLPTVDLSASYSGDLGSTRTTPRSTGVTTTERGAYDGTVDAGIDLNWTIFDGFSVWTNYKQLQLLKEQGELQTRITIEDYVASLTAEYYNYIQEKIRLKNFRYAMSLSRERMRIVEVRYHIGNFSRLDYLQAKVDFNADSAYAYVANQVAFGPRVPNSAAHKACGDYLASELKRFGAKVYQQEAILTAYDGTKLEARNIIGSFDPENSKRVLLFAHWDSRPYSDHDPDPSKHRTPLDGADDGGSGVGALLEIARQIGQKAPGIGIDIIFFDAEDYGTPEFVTDYTPDSWCLGTQFWAKNPHVPNYTAGYGILLDMVGGKNATFFKEQQSLRAAAPIVEMVWSAARDLGYGKYFINAAGGAITDDHQYVISGRNIPSIDIINYDPESKTGFASYWHTQKDNMENIDRETLKAAGQTVLEVIYNR